MSIFGDDQLLQQAEAGPSSAQVVEAVIWLVDHAAQRGVPLRRGQIIITGARLGPMPIPPGRQIRATGGGLGEVHVVTPTRR